MAGKLKVKVIKKDKAVLPAASPKAVVQSKRAAAREVVSTVTNWVSELQGRKRMETKTAIEKFFSTNPQPSEL